MQMGLMEDDYTLVFLECKLQIERISAAASHLYCSIFDLVFHAGTVYIC